MTASVIGIVAGFVFVVVMLLALNLRTDFHWITKLGAIGLAAILYAVTLQSLPGFYGWPSQQALPDKFYLLSMEIHEPVNEADEGAIYMWVIPYGEPDNKPRAYQMAYDSELHSRLTQAGERMALGQSTAGEMESGDGSGSRRGGLPRFYYLEKQRPPAKK